MTFIVLGGGIGGLSASLYLRRFGYHGKIILIESSERLGGWINTLQSKNGTFYELGPRTLRATGDAGYNTLKLAESLGLQKKVVPVSYSHPSAKNRLIKVNGKLNKLPNNFKDAFLKSPPFSKPLAYYLLTEFKSPKVTSTDESIYSFVYRRFGSEIANYIVDPLCRGIFAGNAKILSINSLAKNIYDFEQNYGSITKGLLLRSRRAVEHDNSLCCELINQAKAEKWSVWSLAGGLQTLVDKIESEITECNVQVLKNTNILNLSYKGEKFVIESKDQIFTANKVISCLPAFTLKAAIKDYNQDLYTLLNDIDYVSVAVVNLEYSEDILKYPAFGYLVPSNEKCKVLGVIFDTVTVPQGGATVLTVMMGGYWFDEHLGKNPSKEQILDIALAEIKDTFNTTLMPKSHHVSILKSCIPQYAVGHFEKIDNIKKLIKDLNIPLGLAGNSYNGVGVNDTIYCSKKVVQSMI